MNKIEITEPMEGGGCLRWSIIFILLMSIMMICSIRFCTKANAQEPNAIYLAVQPVDFGLGIRGDYYINYMGYYSSLSYGNAGIYKRNDLKHHIKFTTGILIPMPNYHDYIYDFTVGINYHHLQSAVLNNQIVDPKIFNSWSFELGLTVKSKRFAFAIRTDILRWEPCIDIGIPFKY